jgi:hypothetical protein
MVSAERFGLQMMWRRAWSLGVVLLTAACVLVVVPAGASAAQFVRQASLGGDRGVALSADGNTALLGAPDGPDGESAGSVAVDVRSGSTWTQQAVLTASDETGNGGFGSSVTLSSDGNTALIGGSFDNGHVGAVWVFVRSGSTWTQQGPKLTASDETGGGLSGFGSRVALSSDGNTALIGGPADAPGPDSDIGMGAAWVFARSGSTWTQQGPKLTASDETGGIADFGSSVALSSDGNTALIGGPADRLPTFQQFNGVGAAWGFARSGSTWTQQGPKLTASDETGDGGFGWSVALSSDGNTALIGGPGDDPSGPGTPGAAWVFDRSGSTWTQEGHKLTVGGAGEVGSSVALSSDGTTALIAGPGSGRFDECPCGGGAVFIAGHTLTVAKTSSGSGTVTSSPLGIRCGARCTASYAVGTQVTLTAKSAAGSVFSGWANGACAAERTCTVPLSFDRSVIAAFALEPPNITDARVDHTHGTATFTFTAPGATTLQCALLKPAHGTRHHRPRFAHCRSPKTYTHLQKGTYTFEVRAVSRGPGPAAKRRFSI